MITLLNESSRLQLNVQGWLLYFSKGKKITFWQVMSDPIKMCYNHWPQNELIWCGVWLFLLRKWTSKTNLYIRNDWFPCRWINAFLANDTTTDSVGVGLEPSTLQLLDNLPYHLSHCDHVVTYALEDNLFVYAIYIIFPVQVFLYLDFI